MRTSRYCICGAYLTVAGDQATINHFARVFEAIHDGDGHALCNSTQSSRVRNRRLEARDKLYGKPLLQQREISDGMQNIAG